MAWNDEDEDEVVDHGIEGPDEADVNDEPAEVPCPYCKREILEDSIQCPYCGCYLSQEDTRSHRDWWWYVGLVVVIALIIAWVMRRW